MKSLLRDSSISLAVGATAHTLIYLLMMSLIPGAPSASTSEPSSLTIHFFPWLNVLFAIAPGGLSGFFATQRPMLHGFFSVVIGQLFILLTVATTWYSAPSLQQTSMLIISTASQITQFAIFGLVSGAAGFLLRHMGTNHSFKRTPGPHSA